MRHRLPNFVHVGLQKTGTTLLQRRIFPLFRPGMTVLRGEDIKLVGDRFVWLREPPISERPILYSKESLIGSAARMTANDLSVAERLAAANPEIRVVITLRSQFTIMRSMYVLAVRNGYSSSFGEFADQTIQLGKLNYLTLVNHFREVLGRERVLVLLFEDLIHNPQLSTNLLASFFSMAAPRVSPTLSIERRSENDASLMLRRLGNKVQSDVGRTVLLWTGGVLNRVADGIIGFDIGVRRWRNAIECSFAESNRALFGEGEWTRRTALYPGLEEA